MATETRRIQFDFVARDRGVGKQMKETGDAAEDMNEGLEGGAGKGSKLGAVMGKLGPVMAGVATAAALIGPAVMKGLDAQAANAKFKAQLGLTSKESERIGGVAGRLYSKAYGESMDDVRGAITAVIRNMDGMRNASSADLQATSARAMDLASVMGEDVGPVTVAVGQMMKTGLAKNSKEAFDILTVGAQKGANKAEDLLDTFNEYSTQFRDLGLNGAQAMGIIQQGLSGGARDADVVADAMKELNIRVQDMSAAPALKKLGLDAKEMAGAFARGGPGATRALDQITDRLRKVKNPTERYALAQQILGTQSEDMGKALLKIDPSEATKKLGKFTGATDAAGKAMGSTLKAKLTSFKRTLETQVTNVASKALEKVSKFGAEIKKGFKLPSTGKAANDWQRVGQVLAKVAAWVKTKMIPALKDLREWFITKIVPPIRKFYRDILGELFKQLKKIGKELDKSGIPWAKIGKVVKGIAGTYVKYLFPVMTFLYKTLFKLVGWWITWSIKSYGFLWKRLEVGWKVITRGVAVAKDYYKNFKSAFNGVQRITGQVIGYVSRLFLAWATTMVKGAAKAFGWVPGLGGKLKKAAREMDDFRKRTNDSISKITRSRTVNIKVKAGGSWKDPGGSWSPGHESYAKGGRVWTSMPGATEAYDSVPSMLRLNEHVWTPEEVRAAGGHGAMYRLRTAAKKGLLKGYAKGGPVGVGVDVDTPSRSYMNRNVWRPIDLGMWGMVKKIADKLAKMFGGANGVVAAARSMIGYPYSWGGGGKGGPSYGIGRGAGTYGFDCSGLTEYAWWKGARTSIGGTTYEQWPNSRPSSKRPGALGFPHMGHVVVASDRPGYIIQAPFTGSHVQEVSSGRGYSWRWPTGARFALGGAVQRAAQQAVLYGGRGALGMAKLAGIASDPGRRRAFGGLAARDTPYVVGERGPEVFTPHTTGTVHSSGSSVVVVHGPLLQVDGHVLGDLDEVKTARMITEALRRAKKRGVSVAV